MVFFQRRAERLVPDHSIKVFLIKKWDSGVSNPIILSARKNLKSKKQNLREALTENIFVKPLLFMLGFCLKRRFIYRIKQ